MSWFKFGFGKKKKDDAPGERETLEAPETPEAPLDVPDKAPEEIEPAVDPKADAPVEPQAEAASAPVPDLASAPVEPDEPASAPVEAAPAEPETPVAANVEPVPATPSDQAANTPEDAPAETPADTPADTPDDAPSDAPSNTPSDGVSEASDSKGLFARLSSGLKKSSSRFSDSVSAVFTRRKLDDAALEELEDLLIAADLGAKTAGRVTARLARDKFDKDVSPQEIKEALAEVVTEILEPYAQPLDMSGDSPRVVLFVGVNGSGKTTTLGKIAVKMTREGADVIAVAGDTFRAAAVEQLEVWSQRANATFMSRPLGADAAGLAFDALEAGKRSKADAVLIDTAGRLQNKTELMDELRKIVRVLKKQDDTAPHHVILVLDGTVGSNAISQAEAFMEASHVTGVIMTKLDGTAKGGALVQVAEKFKLPIHFIGVGEGEADLTAFDARAFARALAGLER